ncbi:MAG: hypothetical protein ACYCZN_15575 [Candidatus Dormibacteria bacterium]
MPEVIVSFLDGEVLYGEVPLLHMDDPFLEVDLHSLDGNTRQALVPVAAIRQIDATGVPPIPEDADRAHLARVALHFLDGQVFRAEVVTPASLQRFGAVWDVIEADVGERRILAIPYTALKAAFYVRHWDTRHPLDRHGTAAQVEQRKLAEIQARRSRAVLESRMPPRAGLLSRVGQSQPGREEAADQTGKEPRATSPDRPG